MTIRPADDLGSILSGRAVAADLRETVERALDSGQRVVIDFSGVDIISPSFADELFAKLPQVAVASGRVRFVNLDDDLGSLARFVAAGRS